MYETELKVITIGGATQDTFILYDNPRVMDVPTSEGDRSFLMLEQGCKIDIKRLDNHTGGGATNSALAFKRLGFNVSTFFKIGQDKAGEFILHRLAQEGVNLRCVARDEQQPTGVAFIIPFPTGDRTVLVHRGANCFMTQQELPLDEMRQSHVVYVTSLNGQSASLLSDITYQAKANKTLVAVNPGNGQLTRGFSAFKQSLKNIDILLVNSDEARVCMASLHKPTGPELQQWLPDFIATIHNLGPSMVAVTDGSHGAYASDGKHIYFHPSLPTTVVNTLGAGDAFGSCFVASIARKIDVSHALERGIINSTSVVSHEGAKEGLLSDQEIAERFALIDTKLLKVFHTL